MTDKTMNEIVEKDKEHRIAMHNNMAQKTFYSINTKEFNILRFLFSKIKPDDKELKPVTFSMREFCLLTGINPNTPGNYTYIKNTIQTLLRKIVIAPWLKENGKEVDRAVYWLEPSTVEIDRKDGTITLQVAKIWEPYLVGLAQKGQYFTTSFREVLPMKSVYGKKMYEFLVSELGARPRTDRGKMVEKNYRFTIQYVRELMLGKPEKGRRGKYTNFSDFKSRVLEPAKKDLDKYGNIYMEYKPIRTGRSYTHIEIYFRYNTPEERLQKEKNNPAFEIPAEKTDRIESVEVEETEPKFDYFLYMFNGDQEENAVHLAATEEEFLQAEREERINAFKAEIDGYKDVVAGTHEEPEKNISGFTIDEEKAVAIIKKVHGLNEEQARKYAAEINPFKKIPDSYIIGDSPGAIEKMKELKEQGAAFEVITQEEHERALTAELLIDLGIIELRE